MISVYDTASYDADSDTRTRTRTGSHHVEITAFDLTLLAQIIPPFMIALKKKRKITMCLESDLMTVVQNILRDRPGTRVTLVNPVTGRVLANPYGTEQLCEILSKHVNLKLTSSSSVVAWWKSFVHDHSDVFEPIYNHVRTLRTVVAQQARTKRKAAGGDPSGTSTAARTPPPPARAGGGGTLSLPLRNEDSSWINVQQQMHDQVVSKQLEPVTPPASPRVEARRLTGSEQLQTKTYAAAARVSTATLFDYFYDDLESVAETYSPLFDRNDLYLTNVAEARRLFQLEATVSLSARDRVARGLRAVDLATFPFLAVVCIRFHGTADEPPCSYVTWCLKSACPAFLDGVLHHRDETRCNHAITDLVERCSRRLGVTANQLRQFFTLEVIDDSIGTLTEKSLPVFLATLTGYVDQYVVAPTAAATGTCINATLPVPHVRHRLIFESGSLNAYRFNWLYAKSRRGFVDKITVVLDAVRGCTDIIATFASRYFVHLSAVRAFSSSHPRAAHEINGLWDLFQQQFDHGVIDKVGELNVHFLMLKQIARDRKSNLERAYSAALVFQFRDGAKIPETLSALYEDGIEDSEFRATHDLYVTARRMIKQLTEVKQCMIEAWAAVRDTVHDPGEMFSLLSALVLLRVWVPTAIACPPPPPPPPAPAGVANSALLDRCQTLADGFAHMIKPPRQLTPAEIRVAYLRCHMEDHPDKCTSDADKHAATVRSQVINEANERLLRFYTPQTPPP